MKGDYSESNGLTTSPWIASWEDEGAQERMQADEAPRFHILTEAVYYFHMLEKNVTNMVMELFHFILLSFGSYSFVELWIIQLCQIIFVAKYMSSNKKDEILVF